MKRNYLWFLFLLVTFARVSYGEESTPESLFRQANESYNKGQFLEAKEGYDRLIAQGWASAELFYNRGNASYRLGQLGQARLYFERAAKLDSGDDDIHDNIRLIKTQVQESAPARIQFLSAAKRYLLWLLLIVNIFFFVCMGWGLYSEREWIWWSRWISCVLLVVLLPLAVMIRSQDREKIAVILTPRAEVRSGPGAEYKVGFTVPEGQAVVSMQTVGEWVQIGIVDKSLKGWVPKHSLETI